MRAHVAEPGSGLTVTVAARHRELGLTDAEYELILAAPRPRAEPDRAGDALADVVRALRLQALQEAAAPAAHRGPARAHGPGRERRRGRRRRRPRGGLQGRVPQPPERGRALPGRGHRRRRILRDVFAVGARPIAVLDSLRFGEPDLRALALSARPRRRRDRPLRQLDRRADGRRRGLLRGQLRAELPDQRDVPRARAPRAADPLAPRPARATCSCCSAR